ncbi:hypothetical protein A1Q2_08495 [Trichosporon asahii var. asahii CBS 8904]|uniref:Uncharacterized protein n=1 Tax=Trichosporon asahii var. asahii (strain CBS 8904) TaxID=1220162 RepID=K1W620_TRIAC|nr:hypothetical protein A1Q2_08495 [Trichosporon asahii var. asahii CBS 8904]
MPPKEEPQPKTLNPEFLANTNFPAAASTYAALMTALIAHSEPSCDCGTPHPPISSSGRIESALAKKWVSLTKAVNVGLSHVPAGTIKSADTLIPSLHKIFGQALEETNVKVCPWRGCDASTVDAAVYAQHLADEHGKATKCEVEDDLGFCGLSLVGYSVHAHLELKHGLIATKAKK